MSTPVKITDPETGIEAKVGLGNALAVGPADVSMTYNATLGVNNTPVEIVPPQAGKTFCVTGIILTGNKSISTSVDASVTIFEADPSNTALSINDLFLIPIARSSQSVVTNILLETRESAYIMGKTTDDDVFVTILGFYL